MAAGTDGVPETDGVERGLAAATGTATAAEIGACPPTASAPNFPGRGTERGNAKNGTVVFERPKTSDVSASAPIAAAPGPEIGTTTTGASSETENMEASETSTTTSSRETTSNGRDKRLLLPGIYILDS